ncbi:MAG: hypothetical protein JMHAAFGB_00407 [Dehalococcoides mccartyi]|nr:hypothetical protein [Dehalococcoides mccartyi]
MLKGIEIAAIRDALTAQRKKKTTSTARIPPTTAFSSSWLMLVSMKSDWSKTVLMLTPSPSVP